MPFDLTTIDWVIISRAIHVLAVVVWIGGVWLVTTVLIPGLKQKPPQEWLGEFDAIKTSLCAASPPRICPVIMPGRETTPVADIELMVGISALRSASRVTGATASCLVAPSIS